MQPRLKIWLMAARPKTLPAAAAPVLMGSAMAYKTGEFSPLVAVITFVTALLIQVGTNFANDYFDFVKGADTPDRVGPARAVQAGLISATDMRRAIFVIFSIALVLGGFLVYLGGWPILVIGLVSIVCGILYTGGPKPLAYLGLGELFIIAFFGVIAVWGSFYVHTRQASWLPAIAGFAPGFFSAAILAVNNLRDIDTDRKANKLTLAARFGHDFGRLEFLLLLILAHQPALLISVMYEAHFSVFFALLTFPLSLFTARTTFITREPSVLNGVLATTGQLLLAHAAIFSVGWIL